MRLLRPWRERDDRHLIKATAPSPLPEIDPIEELARIVGEAQERDAEDERRFEDAALGGRRQQPAPRRRGAKGR
jgi:hypothetical protein